jgi:hypothetical protein
MFICSRITVLRRGKDVTLPKNLSLCGVFRVSSAEMDTVCMNLLKALNILDGLSPKQSPPIGRSTFLCIAAVVVVQGGFAIDT